MGVNTAIQSGQNLAWKLAAVLKGHASPQLLATYETERRPVGRRASEQSLVGPAATVFNQGSDDKLLPVERRISVFSLIAGYRYRSEAVIAEDTSSALPAQNELLDKPEQLTGLPGTRVPHLWLERHDQRISTLDLLDGRFVLLVGAAGAPWQQAASAVAASLAIELAAYRIAADGELRDLEDGWQTRMGMPAQGAVLVRPDGFVAWRTRTLPSNPERKLEQVISSIPVPARPGSGRAEGTCRSAWFEHEPHTHRRDVTIVTVAVRFRGFEADGVSGNHHMLIEAQDQLQFAADQIGVLGSAVPHQSAFGGRGAAGLVGHEQEVDVMTRHLTQPLPGDPRLQREKLAIVRGYVRPDAFRPVGAEVAKTCDVRRDSSRCFFVIGGVEQLLERESER